MDRRTAQDHLAAADLARGAAESPPMPRWVAPLAGVAVALGFLVLALLPFEVGWRLAAVLVALALWAGTGWLVVRTRAAQGVRGLRGRSRTVAVVLAVCALSLVPAAVSAATGMRYAYLFLAVVGGLAMWRATRQPGTRA